MRYERGEAEYVCIGVVFKKFIVVKEGGAFQ